MSNEGLDNLFKKGLSGRNVEFNMASWQQMEKMLPPEKKPKGILFGAPSLIVGALALVGSTVLVLSATDVIFESNSHSEITEENISVQNSEPSTSANNEALVISDFSEKTEDIQESLRDEESAVDKLEFNTSNNEQGLATTKSEEASSYAINEPIERDNTAYASGNNLIEIDESNSDDARNQISAVNLFTKILGIGELSTLKLTEEEDHTIIANTSNKLPKMKKNELGFIGGVSMNSSLVDNVSSSEIVASGMFGLTYQRYLNGGLSIKSNLLYSARNGINTQKLHDKKVYGFGSVTEQTMVESQRLVYVELPIMANYSFGNHNVLGGASFSYLVSCLNKVTTETTIQSEAPTYDETTEWGESDGFNPYDFSVVAGYEYNVKPNLNVGLRLNYGLLDVTNNSYFGSNSFDNNVQFRVYLTYSPFRF